MTLDELSIEQAEFRQTQILLKRLIASDIIKALADLSSRCPRRREQAESYLLTEGRNDLQALGINTHRLYHLIDNPPSPKLLKVSNGREPRTRLHGRWLRKPGKKYRQ